MLRSLFLLVVLVCFGLLPVATSCSVKRVLSSAFNTVEGRKSVEANVRWVVAGLGPKFAVTMSPPRARGLTADFPLIKVTRAGNPWLELQRSQLVVSVWPELFKWTIGAKLHLRDSLSNASVQLKANLSVAAILSDNPFAHQDLKALVQASEVNLTTVLEALSVEPGGGVLPLENDCCQASLQIEGDLHRGANGDDKAMLQIQVKHARIRLPRRLGVLHFRDLVVPLNITDKGWILRQPVVALTEGKPLRISLTKPNVTEPLRAQLDGASPIVQLAGIAGGCGFGGPVNLVWRSGQGWGC